MTPNWYNKQENNLPNVCAYSIMPYPWSDMHSVQALEMTVDSSRGVCSVTGATVEECLWPVKKLCTRKFYMHTKIVQYNFHIIMTN